MKHLHCVGAIWVLPWWLHALKFSHKVRRVSTRYNSLLIVSICLQRCWWIWGLDWDMCKEWLRPYQALLSYKAKKYDFWLHGQTFYITENAFQPPTRTAAFIPFPFFLCFPCLGHMSFPHGVLLWCVVCSWWVHSVLSPTYSFSNLWVMVLHACYATPLALVLISASTALSLCCVPSEAVNPPQSLNGSKTTHSFQCECFLTWFRWCFCCGSIFRSCVFNKANWKLGYF